MTQKPTGVAAANATAIDFSRMYEDVSSGRQRTVVLPAGYEMKSMQEVWIVGQRSDLSGETEQWTFSGVFTSKEKAIAACRDSTYFCGACNLDEQAPHEVSNDWLRDAHYPVPRTEDAAPTG